MLADQVFGSWTLEWSIIWGKQYGGAGTSSPSPLQCVGICQVHYRIFELLWREQQSDCRKISWRALVFHRLVSHSICSLLMTHSHSLSLVTQRSFTAGLFGGIRPYKATLCPELGISTACCTSSYQNASACIDEANCIPSNNTWGCSYDCVCYFQEDKYSQQALVTPVMLIAEKTAHMLQSCCVLEDILILVYMDSPDDFATTELPCTWST